jgi:predicted MFS family arabinose efflux permease
MIADKYGAGRVLIGGTILHGLGLLWLSTAPPTNGIVAQIFGVRSLAMLSGFTFLSHQIGSLLGAWLGGLMFDRTGSYNVVWHLAIALGVAAGLLTTCPSTSVS